MTVYTPATLAKKWDCSKATIFRMIERGDLVKMDFPLIRIHSDQIEAIETGAKQFFGGAVYFLAAGDLVKIGYTVNLTYRLRDLRSTSPVELTLLGTVPGAKYREKELHKQFSEYRRHGEWFLNHGSLREFIESEVKNDRT